MGRTIENALVWGMLAAALAGCSTPGSREPTIAGSGDLAPQAEPPSSTGNPESYVVFGKRYYVWGSSEGYRERGIASWYGEDFHGKRTSSGLPYDMYAMTAAHKSLPIPTYVRVTHLGNGRSIVVRVNDRGPFVGSRVIDLSYAAAAKLDMIGPGTAEVEVTALPPYQYLAGFGPGNTARAVALRSEARRLQAAHDMREAERPAVELARSMVAGGSDRPPPATTLAAHNPSVPEPDRPTTVKATYPPAEPAPPRERYQPAPGEWASASPARSAPPLYLQIGAFSDRRNAEQLQSRLASRLDRAIRIDSSTDRLYKVRVGPLDTFAEADRLTLQLAALGIERPHVVLD